MTDLAAILSGRNSPDFNDILFGRALHDIMAERRDQVDKHGFDAEHDLHHPVHDLPQGAFAYLTCALSLLIDPADPTPAFATGRGIWPWPDMFRPTDPRGNLIKAAAMIWAAIDRIDNEIGDAPIPDFEPGAGRPSQGQPTGETATSPGHLKPACHPSPAGEAGVSAEPNFTALAESIVNSDPVISVFAASEWDELHDDGKVWIAAIVRETLARSPAPELLEACVAAKEGIRQLLRNHMASMPDEAQHAEELLNAAIAKATGQ